MKEKFTPWIEECEKQLFPSLTRNELISVLSMRLELTDFVGMGFRAQAIQARNWGVVIVPFDGDGNEQSALDLLFLRLNERFSKLSYALPNLPPRHATSLGVIEVEDYDPPLVAKFNNGAESRGFIRRSAIRMYSDSFLIFPECRGYVFQEVCGAYALIATDNIILREVFGEDIEGIWRYSINNFFKETTHDMNIRAMALEYGYDD